ncbi:Hypothetical protein PBC10988_9870 [Planctomycetales bacterium 10988]|nr:Hypothetical protein PBC10988_9870 [Planctomycetales bacterium 10988]
MPRNLWRTLPATVCQIDPCGTKRFPACISSPLCIIFIFYLFCCLVFHTPVIFGEYGFAYRDAAHFYYPLWQLVHEEWEAGRVPLWNPYENGGSSLVGNPTAAVYYPGQLFFFLPLSYGKAFSLYLVLHHFWAMASVAMLARKWNRSLTASALAGLSYGLGGHVLFQVYNPIFLIGAAWLPWMLYSGERLLTKNKVCYLPWLTLFTSLMILGGDPQSAYLGGLCLAVFWLLIFFRDRKLNKVSLHDSKVEKPSWKKKLFNSSLLKLIGAAGLTLGCVYPQIQATREISTNTTRAETRVPRSIYELVKFDQKSLLPEKELDWYDGFLDHPQASQHRRQIYLFSIGPWRLPEFIWPNLFGRPFPIHSRWLARMPSESETWVPSYYLGLFPFILGISVFHLRRGNILKRWACWILLLGSFACLGEYGLGWLFRELYHWILFLWPTLLESSQSDTSSWPIGPAFGGVYWAMTVLLPLFVQFRFPAKCFLLVAWAFAFLTAWGWDSLTRQQRKSTFYILGTICFLSIVVASVFWFSFNHWKNWIEAIHPNLLYGPFQQDAALADLSWSLCQTFLLSLCLLMIVSLVIYQNTFLRYKKQKWISALVVGICFLDLTLANHWMIQVAPLKCWETTSQLSDAMQTEKPFRFMRPPNWFPPQFTQTSSPKRIQEGLDWDRQSLLPKYNQLDSVEVLQSVGTFSDREFQELFILTRQTNAESNSSTYLQPRRLLDAWNVHYFIVPGNWSEEDPLRSTVGLRHDWRSQVPSADEKTPLGSPTAEVIPWQTLEKAKLWGVQILENPSAFERAWLVHETVSIPPRDPQDRKTFRKWSLAMRFPAQDGIDLQRTALVEEIDNPQPGTSRKLNPSNTSVKQEVCKVVDYQPQEVVIEVDLQKPGVLVLSDRYNPHWQAEVEGEGKRWSATVKRCNLLMKGIRLPVGKYHVRFYYGWTGFWKGWAIAGVSWLVVIGLILVRGRLRWPSLRHR